MAFRSLVARGDSVDCSGDMVSIRPKGYLRRSGCHLYNLPNGNDHRMVQLRHVALQYPGDFEKDSFRIRERPDD